MSPSLPRFPACDPAAIVWRRRLAAWACPDDALALRQLWHTVALYGVAWGVLVLAWGVLPWIAPIAALLPAALTVRLFVIAHDCGHGSYLSSARLSAAVAFWIGVVSLTPHRWWRRCHGAHHSHAGRIDHRVAGDIPLWTVEEYRARSAPRRALYRLMRSPVGLLGILTFVHFVLVHRCPLGTPVRWRREWVSVWSTNAVLGAICATAWAFGFLLDYLVLHGLTLYWACAFGAWLTHSQHQCEHAYWRTVDQWRPSDVALSGSAWLKLPRWLAWISADIGLHHIHHLAPRIPNYRLREPARAFPELSRVRTIGWRDAFRAYRYVLWDAHCARLVTFADAAVGARPATRFPRYGVLR